MKETETPEPTSDSHDEPNDTGDPTVDTAQTLTPTRVGKTCIVPPDDIDDDGDGQTENEGTAMMATLHLHQCGRDL